jgi:KDO2-lipid IV(A) lauroyltransferase
MYDPSRRSLARRILDRCVGWLVEGLFALLRLIGPDRASALGGWIARSLGPYLGVSNVARDNLRRAMPELDAAARVRMLREVWDNLGRTATEFPHMDEIAATRTEIVGGEILERIRASGRGAIFFTAHAANWEIAPRVLQQRGIQLNVIYRTLNNPHIDALIQRYRGTGGESIIAKGAPGARETIRLLQAGRYLGLLLDQKMNDGIPIPFFGIDAMTPPAAATLALRYGIPLVPGQVERLDGAHFRLTIHEPIAIVATGDRHADVRQTMTAVSAEIERWVRADPGRWLWLHRRWPKR